MTSISSNLEIRKVTRTGRRIFGNFGTAYLIPGKGLKYAIVTSKKLGNAVIRNKIRRRIRQILQMQEKSNEISGNIVIIASANVEKCNFSYLNAEINKIFEGWKC